MIVICWFCTFENEVLVYEKLLPLPKREIYRCWERERERAELSWTRDAPTLGMLLIWCKSLSLLRDGTCLIESSLLPSATLCPPNPQPWVNEDGNHPESEGNYTSTCNISPSSIENSFSYIKAPFLCLEANSQMIQQYIHTKDKGKSRRVRLWYRTEVPIHRPS